MNEISNSSPLGTFLNDNSIKEEPKNQKDLGRNEFLKLLVAQLENQDPLSPAENGEFVAQLAQFSSLEEAQNLSASFDNFADSFMSTQHLQATSLVGRPVHVASDTTLLGNEGAVSVLADFDKNVDGASLSVFDQSGAIVDSFQLGPQTAGRNEFVWTGTNADDERHPAGIYSFAVTVSEGDEASNAPIFVSSNVNSVTIEPGGSLTLNLAGIGPTPMSEIIQIN